MQLHNRLTHSLKVEQVGLSLYSKLSETGDLSEISDRNAIAAACLAHDLGHPPFGHAGEEELHALVVCAKHRNYPRPFVERRVDPCKKCLLEDGFEGNAQSFRIITVLAVHKDADQRAIPVGLDLTIATLRAASKYPWARGDNPHKPKKWGAYDPDWIALEAMTGGEQALTLDAQIMDWADDISYAVHDIEDFYRTRHIPIHQYEPKTAALKDFLLYAESPGAVGPVSDEVRTALDQLLFYFPKSEFTGSANDFAQVEKARSTLLTQFINGATVADGNLDLDPIQKKLNAIVKQFIWYHVIDEPKLSNIQAGQRRVLREIFHALRQPAVNAFKVGSSGAHDQRELRRLPHALRRSIEVALAQEGPYRKEEKVYRGLLDYIAGLSDAEAYFEHAVLKGREPYGHL